MRPNLDNIVLMLREAGVEATLEYPGYVNIIGRLAGVEWNIGTANGRWDADLVYRGSGEVVHTVRLRASLDALSREVAHEILDRVLCFNQEVSDGG